jgi:L-lactate dehydrogenase complex protein LldG
VSARDEILRALRAADVPELPLPDAGAFAGVRYPDLRDRFARSVAEVGGRCAFVLEGTVAAALLQIPEYAAARKVVSLLPGIGNVDLTAIGDPHELADVDFCVLPAELGVAENGACWITDHGRANRAVCYLAQHLAVVVSAANLVHNLHEAYARIELPRRGFSMWLSGPSKTADIEQALVIGAHGARSCTVLVTS